MAGSPGARAVRARWRGPVGVALAVGAVGAFVPGFFSDLKAEVESGGATAQVGRETGRSVSSGGTFSRGRGGVLLRS